MKDFTRPKGRLRSLSFHARLVYSIFALFTLVALGLTVWLTELVVGADLARLDSYYAGVEVTGTGPGARDTGGAGPREAAGGPLLELPAEAEEAPPAEPMSIHKLLEVTHFHLFSMPVYLLILSHLFMLSRLGDGTKTWVIALATVSTAAHVAAPWAARAAGPGATALYGISGAGLGLSYLLMCAIPLWEMWTPTGTEPARAAKER